MLLMHDGGEQCSSKDLNNTVSLSRHEQTCSWRDKLVVLWTLNRGAKISLRKDFSDKYDRLCQPYFINGVALFFTSRSGTISLVSFWIISIFAEPIQLASNFLFLLSISNTGKSLLSNFTSLFSKSAEILLFSSVVGFIFFLFWTCLRVSYNFPGLHW